MDTIIPIFPLHIVVYPNSVYPLHIFEERYKKLVLNAIRYNTSFGITPMIDKKLTPIGTIVRVEEKLNQYANGEFDIVVRGLERFKISRWWIHDIGYAEALIKVFKDTDAPANQAMESALEYKFREALEKVHLVLDDGFWNNLIVAKSKSFKIAEKSGLSLEQQVLLLETKTEEERISMLLTHFSKITEYQQQRTAAIRISMNDGYINR